MDAKPKGTEGEQTDLYDGDKFQPGMMWQPLTFCLNTHIFLNLSVSPGNALHEKGCNYGCTHCHSAKFANLWVFDEL